MEQVRHILDILHLQSVLGGLRMRTTTLQFSACALRVCPILSGIAFGARQTKIFYDLKAMYC